MKPGLSASEEKVLHDSDLDLEKDQPRTLTLFGAISLIIGCMVGVGVFVSGAQILAQTGSPGMAIILWFCGAFVALCGGFSYTEWSLMLPQNGGDIAYLNYAFPKPAQFFSFLYCWCRILLIHPSYVASMSILSGEFLYRTFVPNPPASSSYDSVELTKKGIALLFLASLFVLCAFSNAIATRTSVIITGLKLVIVAFVLLTAILAATIGFGDFENPRTLSKPFQGTKTEISLYATALFDVFFAYDGWANLSMVTGELQNPSRNISRAIIVSVLAVAAIYLSVNTAFFGVLSATEMIGIGEDLTLALTFATKAYGSQVAGSVMAVLIMISAFGAGLCVAYGTARVGQYAGQLRILPFSDFLGKINPRFQTPFNSLLVNTVIAAGMIAIPPGSIFFKLVRTASFGIWMFYGITLIGLLLVRYREPNRPRPFRVFLFCPIVVIITSVFLFFVPFFGNSYKEAIIGFTLVLLGIPVYYTTLYRRVKQET